MGDPGTTLSNLGGTAGAAVTEAEIWRMNQAFVAALDSARIPHTGYFYGAGTHSWPYWIRDLRHFLIWLKPYLAHPAPAPAPPTSPTAPQPTFSAWSWQFAIQRAVPEFVYLTNVGAGGLTAVGSGQLHVLSAPLYRPGRQYVLEVGARREAATAARDGRLHFGVDLGPSHTVQQYAFGPRASARWSHITVRITPAG